MSQYAGISASCQIDRDQEYDPTIPQLQQIIHFEKTNLAAMKHALGNINTELAQIRAKRNKLEKDAEKIQNLSHADIAQCYGYIGPWVKEINFICSAAGPIANDRHRQKLEEAIMEIYKEVGASLKYYSVISGDSPGKTGAPLKIKAPQTIAPIAADAEIDEWDAEDSFSPILIPLDCPISNSNTKTENGKRSKSKIQSTCLRSGPVINTPIRKEADKPAVEIDEDVGSWLKSDDFLADKEQRISSKNETPTKCKRRISIDDYVSSRSAKKTNDNDPNKPKSNDTVPPINARVSAGDKKIRGKHSTSKSHLEVQMQMQKTPIRNNSVNAVADGEENWCRNNSGIWRLEHGQIEKKAMPTTPTPISQNISKSAEKKRKLMRKLFDS